MKIVLSGVETNNKGAELMLYAILQEIERKWPQAEVYISPWAVRQGIGYVHTTLKLKYWPYTKLLKFTHFNGLLKRLNLPMLDGPEFMKVDYFLDGSGFRFSDQCRLWGDTPERWDWLLKNLRKRGAQIIFLPQAFGPIEMDITKRAIKSLGQYSKFLIAREHVSYNYLEQSHLVDMGKVKLYPDFTVLVSGVIPTNYSYLRGGICVIPNLRMIDSGKISYDDYIKLLSAIIEVAKVSGHPVYMLNHEGENDEELCHKCKDSIGEDIEIVTNLNALQVKGLISSAYLVISSRFHGVVSALNSKVPSLATSWSHKYEELFRDYELENCILPLNNIDTAVAIVKNKLDISENSRIRRHLELCVSKISDEVQDMWREIWD